MSSKEEHPSYFRNSRQHPNSRAALFGQNILSSYYPLEFWDNISKIIAKKYALSERYRRQWVSGKAVEPATEFPKNGISTIFEDMKLMAEEEPNIVDTRKYPSQSSIGSRTSALPPQRQANNKRKQMTITASHRSFLPHLRQYGVYINQNMRPGGPSPPENLEEIKRFLSRRRKSLSVSEFPEDRVLKFEVANARAYSQFDVECIVDRFIAGETSDSNYSFSGHRLNNLAPLTDGRLTAAKPDSLDGADPITLHLEIREELDGHIIPSDYKDRPMLPNFFLKVKGPSGSAVEGERQACYNGALGARGMHSLQAYMKDSPCYDNNAYTITAAYSRGHLKLYASHVKEPQDSGSRPEYITTPLGSWSMVDNPERFREGTTWYRNARDWAMEKRNEFIKDANARFSEARAREAAALQSQMVPEIGTSGSTANSMETKSQNGVGEKKRGSRGLNSKSKRVKRP